jgi:hypothetical protein
MVTPAQLFIKKIILGIINFVKKNWFVLILLSLSLILFCALVKDNIEEPFDTSTGSIPPDPTNPTMTEGQLYGIIPFEASVNLFNKQEILTQFNNIDNAPEPKKEFTMTTTSFNFTPSQGAENTEEALNSFTNTSMINSMATRLGGVAAATAAFNSITGNLASGANTSGIVQGTVASAAAATAFQLAQEEATVAAEDKAKEIATDRAKQIGTKVKGAITAAGNATAAATAAAVASAKNFFRVVSPATATKVSEKVTSKVATKVGPQVMRRLLTKIGTKIGMILTGRIVIMQVIAASLASTVVGVLPAAIIQAISTICMAINATVSVAMAGALMGNPPTCPAGYQRLDENIPQNVNDGLALVPIVGDVLGMIGPNICASNSCPPGMQEDAGLCYPPCDQGYNGIGPVCWSGTKDIGVGVLKSCPPGWTDIGLICSGPGLAAIGKFDNDSRLVCPSHKPNAIDGLCYANCDYTPAYTVTTKLPRYIRPRNMSKSNLAWNRLQSLKNLITNNPATLSDLNTVLPPLLAKMYDVGAGNNPTMFNYYNNITSYNGNLAQINSQIESTKYTTFIGFGQISSNMILNSNQKNFFNTWTGLLNNKYNTLLSEDKKAVPGPTVPYIANPEVPVPPFTELAPIQPPQYSGTMQVCTGNPNQWVPGTPGIPAVPAKPAEPAIPAQPFVPGALAIPAIPAVPAIPGTTTYPTFQLPIPPGYDFDTTQNRYVPNPAFTTMRFATVVGYMNGATPVFGPVTIGGRAGTPAVPAVPARASIQPRAAIPAKPAVPAVPAVPGTPGYYVNTQVCQTVPKPNPLYNLQQHQTDYAAWLARKNNTPPPTSTPESAIPTWDQVINYPAQYPAAHVPGMPYLCGGRRGLSYGRGAGKPKLNLVSATASTPLPPPPPAQTADAFANSSNFKCNSNYKLPSSLEQMCRFYYIAARAHAANEATGTTATFTYIRSITKIIASSERSCDVICQMATKNIINIVQTSTQSTNQLSSAAAVNISENTDRRFYFARVAALCNLAPNTNTPSKLSYKTVACTNVGGFAQDAINIPASDGSYGISFTFVAPTI